MNDSLGKDIRGLPATPRRFNWTAMTPDEPTRAKGVWNLEPSSFLLVSSPLSTTALIANQCSGPTPFLAHSPAPASYLGFHYSGSLRYSSTRSAGVGRFGQS